MSIQVRRVVNVLDETHAENGRSLERTHRVAMVGAVISNPYPSEYTHDLVTMADALGEEVGALVGPPCVKLLGDEVEAFGKAALVGIDGEVEHGSAIIHNLRFGNMFRDAASGTELLPAAEKVGPPGGSIDIPLKHKLDSKTRSHHQTVTFQAADVPRPREIVVICAAANAGRPLSRLASFGTETKTA